MADLLPKKENRLVSWVKRIFLSEDPPLISPGMVLLNFALLGVLSSILLVRLSYSKRLALQGLLLIWVGCAVEVLTWFLPVYSGIFAALSAFLKGILPQCPFLYGFTPHLSW
ncbi:MAG: hypothetical protein Q8P03_01365 [bacterium]|nr:hypothetical protein [bacterium]